jgi:exopolysaccharide production protein ExoZ
LTAASVRAASLQSLQILRAVAAGSVVYYHILALPHFGSFGVDIFFVLSGFVMAMVVAQGQSPSAFVISRVSRVVPLYWLLTTGLLLLAVVVPRLFNSTTADLGDYLKSLLFIPYFKDNGKLHPMLFVGWTLNYEMFFYACVWVGMVLARARTLWISAALLTAAFVVGGLWVDDRVANAFFGKPLLFEFVMGMLAFDAHRRGWGRRLPAGLCLAVALGGFVFMAVVESVQGGAHSLLWFGLPALAVVYATVLLEPALQRAPPALVRSLAAAGDASYATYLSHPYVVELVRKIVGAKLGLVDIYTPWGVLVTIGVALGVGQLLYMLVDKPLSRRLRAALTRLWQRRAAPAMKDAREALR